MTITYTTASLAQNFINSIGVNSHIDFLSSSYSNLSAVENAITYLGVKNLRDSPENTADLGATGLWQQVANATGAKFDAYMPEGSAANMQTSLSYISTLAGQGILNFLEGGNEEDQPYATSQGNNLTTTAQFQQQVATLGQQLGLKVINMSFGVGWGTSSTGDYGTVGNLAAYTDYANAHVYPGTGNSPGSTLSALDADANLAAVGKPVINTELGWYTTANTTDASAVSATVQAKYALDGLLDAYKMGAPQTDLYELLDQHAGSTNTEYNFGLFNADGTPKLAATAIHNLTTLLADNGGSFTPGQLGFQLSGTLATDNCLLLEKSDGSFWLAVWNETRLSGPTSPSDISVANHTVTLTLTGMANVQVFDPLTSTASVQSANGTTSVALSVPDHPILVEIQPVTAPVSSTGSGQPAPTAQDLSIAIPSTATAYTTMTNPLAGVVINDAWASAHAGSMALTNVVPTAQDLDILLPSAASVAAKGSSAVTGISIFDPWASPHAGSMILNLNVGVGAMEISNGTSVLSGSSLQVTGSLAQLNADLATLHYDAPAGAEVATLSLNAWNQAGVSVTHSLGLTII